MMEWKILYTIIAGTILGIVSYKSYDTNQLVHYIVDLYGWYPVIIFDVLWIVTFIILLHSVE